MIPCCSSGCPCVANSKATDLRTAQAGHARLAQHYHMLEVAGQACGVSSAIFLPGLKAIFFWLKPYSRGALAGSSMVMGLVALLTLVAGASAPAKRPGPGAVLVRVLIGSCRHLPRWYSWSVYVDRRRPSRLPGGSCVLGLRSSALPLRSRHGSIHAPNHWIRRPGRNSQWCRTLPDVKPRPSRVPLGAEIP